MKYLSKHKAAFLFVIFFFIVNGLTLKILHANDNICANGISAPPFFSIGVEPNLLLLIDNSASMYDLAYVDEQSYCFDNSYDVSTSYTGYFEADKWYYYNESLHQFENLPWHDTISTWTGAAGTPYHNAHAHIKIDSGTDVTAFFAMGNYLNWATASKLDIEKKILTGGKYETAGTYGSPNGRLVMESRGCMASRFIKQVAVSDSSNNTYYLTLGIKSPDVPVYEAWENGNTYQTGSIVTDVTDYYRATSAGTSNGSGVTDDDGVSWEPYTPFIRWTAGTNYPANSIVSDDGKMWITANGGTANGSGAADDTGIADWVEYNVTDIEIFPVTNTGFDHSDCALAIQEMGKDSPNQGQLKSYIDGCLGFEGGGGNSKEADSNAAFNHSTHNCWYLSKQGTWPPGAGPTSSVMNDCENIYTKWGTDPWDITPWDEGYVCYGVHTGAIDSTIGYVGRCWDPGDTATCTCPENQYLNKNQWPAGYEPPDLECCKPNKIECPGGTDPDWDAAGYDSPEACVEAALQDYCQMLEIPEVIDPTDQASETNEFWNIPSVLTDSGVVSQVGLPIELYKGYIKQEDAPVGLIQEFTDDLRIGAMSFNNYGSKTECEASTVDPHILSHCKAGNKDGGKIISYIDKSEAHTNEIVSAINAIKATNWTPIAEAMFTAIGYYTQRSDLRLDTNDFDIDPTSDPIQFWCQNNNILVITDGASTTDRNSGVINFTEGDADTDDISDCGSLDGSTFLDDLSYYAWHGDIYPSGAKQLNGSDKFNIKTHIVVAGKLRVTGTDECSPDVLLGNAAQNSETSLYQAENPSELETKIREAFSAIRAGASSGSAASVISSSRTGEGAVYQAIFWPELESQSSDPIVWAGEVHALFVDESGNIYEDTNDDRIFNEGDLRVTFYFDDYARATKACYGKLNTDGTCNGTSKGLDQVHFLWSASKWLASISNDDITYNRSNYISNERKRYVYTWNDLNNDGIAQGNEWLDFTEKSDWVNAPFSVSTDRGPIPLDFGVQTSSEVNAIINWIRGLDDQAGGMRSRQTEVDFDHDGTPSTITWRLGDVIHSTPMSVSRPTENYHLIYKDSSYGNFKATYNNRRHVIYFGANDGLFHAVNAGFYNQEQKKFCLTEDCTSEELAPELGAELWAYAPYNLLPHLKCLANPSYEHKYFVDLRPRIFDVQIFPDDSVHPGGWGTILVGGMRFGGYEVSPGSLDLDNNGTADYPNDVRKLASTYFIFDITDHENPPVLLGELTHASSSVNLGYSTAIPTVVPMKDGTNTSWYLILGSGPTDLDGSSLQRAKVTVFPLNSLVGSSTPFRIPNSLPSSTDNIGRFELTDNNSFVSDLITVDFDLNHDYKADTVYFGTVEGSWGAWGGKLYRLITHAANADGIQVPTVPSDWNDPTPLIDTSQPITGAPAVASDGENFWVFFGTGRFLDKDDKLDSSQQSYYGIKEPRNCDGNFTWDTVEIAGTPDSTPGNQGLLRIDQILVHTAGNPNDSTLSCIGGGTSCLPTGVTTFNNLIEYIAGTGCSSADPTGTDGWYRQFIRPRERNLGQAALLGGLLTFTTYQPYEDVCLSEGLSYLYGGYYQTGTAWHEAVFLDESGSGGLDADQNVIEQIDLGHGMATTPSLHVGKERGSKAFVQTSTGSIVEIPQPNLPIKNVKTGKVSWIELTE